MAEIQQIQTLNTVASIRKAAQESMRPIIAEVEKKMSRIESKMDEISEQFVKFSGLDLKMIKNQQSNRYLCNKVVELSDKLCIAELQATSDRQKCGNNFEQSMLELHRIRKQNEKTTQEFNFLQIRNEKALKNIEDEMKRLKEREQKMNQDYKQFNTNSAHFKNEVAQTTANIKQQFDKMRTFLNGQLKDSERRIKLLDMYEAQKDITAQKLSDIFFKIQACVKDEDFQLYKNCNLKQQERVVKEVQKIFDQNLSDDTRELIKQIPQFKKYLDHCLTFQSNIKTISSNVAQIENNIAELDKQNKEEKRQFKQELSINFKTIDKKREEMNEQIKDALSLRQEIKTRIDAYSDQLKRQLRQQNERKSRQLYQEIKITFQDAKEASQQKHIQSIVEQRNKLEERCQEVAQYHYNIHKILSNFSTKFTLIKSDTQLFEKKVLKQLQQIVVFKRQITNNNAIFGKILAEITEAILANYCLDIQDSLSPADQILLTTEKDGVIYQKYPNSNDGKIVYRRKLMEPQNLRKAIAFSLLQVYDNNMKQDCCLKWNQHSPSHFFRQNIEPTYLTMSEQKNIQKDAKFDKFRQTIDLSTIPGRHTISTAFQKERNFNSRNLTTRSRKSRYSDFEGSQIFAHKSTRRVRMPLNSSLGMT